MGQWPQHIWKMNKIKKEEGIYTIEASLCITIFIALFVILLSAISLIRVETIVQTAINQTAMQIAQYSYLKNPEEFFSDAKGGALCSMLTKKNLSKQSDILKYGVIGGEDGLDFKLSKVLVDGKTVDVVVIYSAKLDKFGITDKTISVCQSARTVAWLPPEKGELCDLEGDSKYSIWNEDNFVRGSYFVNLFKEKYRDAAVKSGQGIDLYFKSERKIVEVCSMNLFSPTYASFDSEDETQIKNASLYSANKEGIEKRIGKHIFKFQRDIRKTQRLIEMEDGSLGNFGRLNEKKLIVVVPVEAKKNKSFLDALDDISKSYLEKGYVIDFKYMEEALV